MIAVLVRTWIIAVLLGLTSSALSYEGYGSVTTGGEGGEVYRVTSLADAGPGTLREAVTARDHTVDGPRVVVFDVAGTITLESDIRLREAQSHVTVDGSTAPSPGITITKVNPNDGEFLLVGAHDVILSHLRFRGLWEEGGVHQNSAATLSLDGGSRRVILDHITARNATDGGPDLWCDNKDVTISWSFFFYNFHPTTVSCSDDSVTRERISMHHNVFAHNGERNPQLAGDVRDFDYVNNVVYRWGHFTGGSYGMRIKNAPNGPHVRANLVNNYFLGDVRLKTALVYGTVAGADADDCGPDGSPAQDTVVTSSCMGPLYVRGNVLPADNVDHYSTVPDPIPVPASLRVTTWPASELGTRVLPDVGMRYRDAEEQAILDAILEDMGGAPGGGDPPGVVLDVRRSDRR